MPTSYPPSRGLTITGAPNFAFAASEPEAERQLTEAPKSIKAAAIKAKPMEEKEKATPPKEVTGDIGVVNGVVELDSKSIINDLVANTTIEAIKGTPELLKDMTANERRELLLQLPSQPDKASEERLLVEVLGVGGTQALQSIITDVNLTPQQKVNILIEVFGFTQQVASRIVR